MRKFKKWHIFLIIAGVLLMFLIGSNITSKLSNAYKDNLYAKDTPERAIEQVRHINDDDILVYDIVDDVYVGCIYGEDGFFDAVAGIKEEGEYKSVIHTSKMWPEASFTEGIRAVYTFEYDEKAC